jgi:hypothetical protein
MHDSICSLPKEIQNKILNYLYFSYPICDQISIVNNIIKKYHIHLSESLFLCYVFRKKTLYFRMINYLYQHLESNRVEKIICHYDTLDDIERLILNIMSQLSLYENQKVYKFLTF